MQQTRSQMSFADGRPDRLVRDSISFLSDDDLDAMSDQDLRMVVVLGSSVSGEQLDVSDIHDRRRLRLYARRLRRACRSARTIDSGAQPDHVGRRFRRVNRQFA